MSIEKCIVHYNALGATDDNVLPLTRKKYDRLIEARAARYELGGDNWHSLQGKTIPVSFRDNTYGCHKSCYKKIHDGHFPAEEKVRHT